MAREYQIYTATSVHTSLGNTCIQFHIIFTSIRYMRMYIAEFHFNACQEGVDPKWNYQEEIHLLTFRLLVNTMIIPTQKHIKNTRKC